MFLNRSVFATSFTKGGGTVGNVDKQGRPEGGKRGNLLRAPALQGLPKYSLNTIKLFLEIYSTLSKEI